MCKCCKLYEDTDAYLQQNNLKTCQGCRDYKGLHKNKDQTPTQPREQEQDTTDNKPNKITYNNIINSKIEQVLNYLKTKYQISENIQDIQHI